MVLPDSYGVSRAPHYSGSAPGRSHFSATGLLPSMVGLSKTASPSMINSTPCERPTTPGACSLVWANPRSLAATDGITVVFFSSGYLDVSVPLVCLLPPYGFRCGYLLITAGGFPHSDIPGSRPAYGSPRHFVVRHVLHRLLAPRHPPCALCSLTLHKA